jgi:hypothetical protein
MTRRAVAAGTAGGIGRSDRRSRRSGRSRTIRRFAAAALMPWWLSDVLLACPVCFRVEDGPDAAGVRTAVVVLAGVTVSVLACCGAFLIRFARRAASASTSGAQK